MECGLGWGWWARRHHGHTPLAALRWLAPLSWCERGVCSWAVRFLAVGVCLIDLRVVFADFS